MHELVHAISLMNSELISRSSSRFLADKIRENFGFIGSAIWFNARPRNKKKLEK
jgi:predicted GTPase